MVMKNNRWTDVPAHMMMHNAIIFVSNVQNKLHSVTVPLSYWKPRAPDVTPWWSENEWLEEEENRWQQRTVEDHPLIDEDQTADNDLMNGTARTPYARYIEEAADWLGP